MYIVHVLGLIVKTKGVLSLYEYYDQQKLLETLHAIDMDTTQDFPCESASPFDHQYKYRLEMQIQIQIHNKI